MIRVLRWNVRWQFLSAFLLVGVLPISLFAAITYQQTVSSLHKVENEKMAGQARGVEAILAKRQGDERRYIHDWSAWDALATSTDKATSNSGAQQRRAQAWIDSNVSDWVPATSDTNLVIVFNNAGEIISQGAHDVVKRPTAIAFWNQQVVAKARQGDRTADLMAYDGRVYIVSAAPITMTDEPDRSHGVLVFGQAVTDEVLREINQVTGSDSKLALFSVQHTATTSTDPLETNALATFEPTAHKVGQAFVDGAYTSQMVLLSDNNGVGVAHLKVSVPRTSFVAALTALRGLMGYALLGTLLIAVIVGWLLARTVSRPIQKLAGAAEAMAGGEIRQRIHTSRHDEIGKLARAFNVMSEQVATNIEDLSARTQNLSVEIANLNAFGTKLAQTADVHAELRRLADMIQEIFGSGFAAVYLVRDGKLELAGFSGLNTAPVPAAAVHELAAWVVAHDQTTQTADLSRDERLSPAARRSGQAASSGALVVPMTRQNGVVGAIAVGSDRDAAFTPDDMALLSTVAAQVAVALQNAEAYQKLNRMYLETVTALAAAMEAKDQYTAEHADNLATMAVAVGRKLGLSQAELRQIQFAAVLHDIGKIGIPGAILNKPSRLTEDEFGVMAEHTIIGERIISRIDYLLPISTVIRSAHERWDGKGYPDGVAGDEIPLGSRILLVCDAFHAMTSDRPYRKALPEAAALAELRDNAGTQFDPRVIEAFLEAYPFEEADPVGQFSHFSFQTAASLN